MNPRTAANNYSAKQLVLFSEITGTTRGTNPTRKSNDPTSRNLKCDCYNYCAVTNKDVSHCFGMSALIVVKGKISQNVAVDGLQNVFFLAAKSKLMSVCLHCWSSSD